MKCGLQIDANDNNISGYVVKTYELKKNNGKHIHMNLHIHSYINTQLIYTKAWK